MLCGVILCLLAQFSNSASVEGVVARLGTGEPLARATVTLSRNGNMSQFLSTTTGDSGRFSFLNVPPGEYRLQASRQGPYIPAEYGQHNPNERGTPITIQPGQKITEIRLELAPTSSISGRILDSDGEPLGRVEVQALQSFYSDGHRVLKPVQAVMTNDLGEYRLRLLPPGRYYISALVANPQAQQAQLFIKPPPAGPSISLSDAVVTVIPYVSRRVLEDGTTEDYMESPVYFPGVIDSAFATALDLHAGENPNGFDFTTASGRLHARRIQGKVISGVTGQPAANASIVVVSRIAGSVVFTPMARSADDGSFEIRGVTTGPYSLFAFSTPGSRINPFFTSGTASARIPIEIGDRDLENLSVVVAPNFKIPVRVRFAGENSNPAAAPGGRLTLSSDPPLRRDFSQNTNVTDGGVGEIEGISPGDYRISLFGGPGYIQLARLGSADVLNDGLHLDREPEESLDIVIGTTTASLEGRVTDGTEAVSNAVAVLVPSPSLRHRSDLYYYAATDSNGHFQIQARIVPGDYKVFAWKDIEPGGWRDPEVLQRYENQGQPVSITSDSKLNMEVRLVR